MDSTPSRSGAPGPASRTRRRLLALGYLAALVALAEAVAYLGLSYLAGHATSAAELRARMATVGELDEGQAAQDALADADRRRIVHPFLGYLMRSWNPEREDLARLDMPGLYGPDSPIFDDDPDSVVVAVTGGSVAVGFSHHDGIRQLAEHLEAHPRFAGKRFRFVSMASGGWKQPQQLMALGYLLALGGHVDLLVDLAGFNEIALHELENQDQGVSTVYPRSWYFLGQRDVLSAELEQLEDLHRERVRAARAALRSPLGRLWTYRLAWVWSDGRLRAAERALQAELRGIEHDARERSPAELIALGPPIRGADRAERLEELVGLWERCALQMRNLCLANGIEFFECLQPNQYVPDSKPLSAEEREAAIESDPARYRPLVQAGYPRLRAAGARLRDEHGLHFVDLTSIFEDVDATVYVDDCCHLNDLGNARMAREIARAILAATP